MWIGRPPRTAVLAPYVSLVGYSENDDVPHRYEHILPTGTSDLLVNLHQDRFWTHDEAGGGHVSGAVFGGPHAEPNLIDTADQRAILSVCFQPGGGFRFFGPAAGHADGGLVDLDTLWGTDGKLVRERLLAEPSPDRRLALIERILLERMAVHPESGQDDRAIAFAATAFERGTAVSAVIETLGWTPKRFIRRFTERIGLPPKRYARVRRLQRVLTAVMGAHQVDVRSTDVDGTDVDSTVVNEAGVDLTGVDWARVACEHGFFDQAHLVNDFKALTGRTPTAYRPRSPFERNHIPLES